MQSFSLFQDKNCQKTKCTSTEQKDGKDDEVNKGHSRILPCVVESLVTMPHFFHSGNKIHPDWGELEQRDSILIGSRVEKISLYKSTVKRPTNLWQIIAAVSMSMFWVCTDIASSGWNCALSTQCKLLSPQWVSVPSTKAAAVAHWFRGRASVNLWSYIVSFLAIIASTCKMPQLWTSGNRSQNQWW